MTRHDATPAHVRAQLIDTLRLDLIGPRPDHPAHARYAEEVLPVAPSRWYLSGFLVPHEAPIHQRSDHDGDDMPDEARPPSEGDDDGDGERASARKAFFPSSMGLSVLVPAEVTQLRARVAWGDYVPIARPVAEKDSDSGEDETSPAGRETGDTEDGNPAGERAGRGRWRRIPRVVEKLITVRAGTQPPIELPEHPRLQLVVSVRTVDGGSGPDDALVPAGTRSVSVFLVNHRDPAPDVRRDAAYVFQPELSLHGLQPFVARPNIRGRHSDDRDEQVADLQYRDAVEYAVGHNVSALATLEDADDGQRVCRQVSSAWMPRADVEKVVPAKIAGVELGMEALANAPDASAVRAMVGPMIAAYGTWIATQGKNLPRLAERRATAESLLGNAERARQRIQGGLDMLDDPLALDAFRLTNRAIATAIRQRICHNRNDIRPADVVPPAWRPFQLAFLLMNMAGLTRHDHPDRQVVDLLFFPTGGGKTEAYLGLAAFAMVLRRLRDPSIQSAGVSVLMRYTLRLLTLDQLGRAATLICALELLRQDNVDRLGPWPFEIGLWVGRTATPNRMGKRGDGDEHSARARTLAFQNDSGRKPSPIPLENCPWCGWKFDKDCFKLLPDSNTPRDLRVRCRHKKCAFAPRKQKRGLPILAIDDPIYRRLPAFLIATVDKFANLPWVGETAGLFGRVQRYDEYGFYGANPRYHRQGKALAGSLPPPDLVIQDELHLISGPLGTMVGLYETAIDALCQALPHGKGGGAAPKIVASTATVRRAERQIRGLFGRSAVEVFPPPGPNRRDSFFAETVGPDERNPRTYVGVAAQGRNFKVVLLRTYLALMGAAMRAWHEHGGDDNPRNPADPYMTLLGYFNSLRELGGSRRIVEDEVRTRLVDYGRRRLRVGEKQGLFRNRPRLTEPRELTSRVSTNEVADTKRRLALGFQHKERVDVALATNMISVGLDITRLGLMVVLGQPKTAAEYIQTTSRVGRDDERPGLVVTLLNVYRPRDRSHYERFAAWHESFYRAVEATSVTPFSPRAIDRGVAAVTVALARLGHPGMTPPRGALAVTKHRPELDYVADVISQRAARHDALDDSRAEELRKKVKDRVSGLLDAWALVATDKGDLQYQRETGGAPPLLFQPLDPELQRQGPAARQFKAPRSLRDVEPTVNLWLQQPEGLDADLDDLDHTDTGEEPR